MKMKWLAMGLAATAIGVTTMGAATHTAAAQETEQPKYTVISTADNIEIREYAPMIVAQANIPGQRSRAMSRGFRVIADYIFGNNLSQTKVAMTSPVTQQAKPEGEKIAMTSPVTQQSDGETWEVRFIMPSKHTMETLPTPKNPRVTLLEVPAKRFAAIRFSGWGRQTQIDRYTADLEAYLAASDQATVGSPTYAFYDGPWTPAAQRRNEVMIELAADEPS